SSAATTTSASNLFDTTLAASYVCDGPREKSSSLAISGGRSMRLRLALRPVIAITALLLLVAPSATAQNARPGGEAAGASWSVYGGNLFNQGYSALDQSHAT